MWALVNNGTVSEWIETPRAIKLGTLQHPKSIFTLWDTQELISIGIYPVAVLRDPVDPVYQVQDSDTVTVGDSAVTITAGTVDLDVEQVRSNWLANVRAKAGELLSQTDWYVTRRSETGVDIPTEITYQRALIRNMCNDIEDNIGAAQSGAEISQIVSSIVWPD